MITRRKQKRFTVQAHAMRVFAFLGVISILGYWLLLPAQVRSAGIDDVTITLTDSEAVNTETRVSVVFTPTTNLDTADVISIYLGENTAGDEFTDGDADQSGADIACTQTGATFGSGTYAAASATVPMKYTITKASGAGSVAAVTCTLGSLATDAPSTPTVADNYSVAVVTTDDSGAGVVYVGNANDVTVSATVLPNLALAIDNADGTTCTTTSGVTSCNLGVLTTAAVNTGNYDVNVGTNATSGATIKVIDDGNLRNGADDIDDITENTTVAAGTEGNGVAVTSDAAWTEASPFDDDDTPTTTSAQNVASTSGPIDIAGNDVTVTHRAAISSLTKALVYSHIVTWTAVANF